MSNGIIWENSMSKAINRAKENNMLILIDFFGNTWGACIRMETGTFQTSAVQEAINADFIPLKYESGRDAEQFMRFSIKATPAYVFLDADGNEIYRTIGYHEVDDFMNLLKLAQEKTA